MSEYKRYKVYVGGVAPLVALVHKHIKEVIGGPTINKGGYHNVQWYRINAEGSIIGTDKDPGDAHEQLSVVDFLKLKRQDILVKPKLTKCSLRVHSLPSERFDFEALLDRDDLKTIIRILGNNRENKI